MTRQELLTIVSNALQNCITANQERLTDKFTIAEINDFANTVVYYLPPTQDTIYNEIDDQLLSSVEDNKIPIVNANLINIAREIALSLVKPVDTELYLHHLIFFALMKLKLSHGKNIDDVLRDTTSYYKSLLLPADQLQQNIQLIEDIDAVSYFNNKGGYLRVNTFNHMFVPTLTTKENFNFLIPKEYNGTSN